MVGLFAFIALLAGGPAFGQSNSASTVDQQTAARTEAPNPLDKVVCRSEETIGSRLKKHKVCATLREWKDQEDQNRREVERSQRNVGQDLSF